MKGSDHGRQSVPVTGLAFEALAFCRSVSNSEDIGSQPAIDSVHLD
jgi:hypothetical protein